LRFQTHLFWEYDENVKNIEEIKLELWSLYSKIELNEDDINTYMTVFLTE
jgi:hypothetical protein